jgi:hypothetical protein
LPELLRKKIIEETPELTERLNTELQIVLDLIEATEQGGDCLDPAVIEFQQSCHVMTRNNYSFLYLEQLQADRTGKPKITMTNEPFFF